MRSRMRSGTHLASPLGCHTALLPLLPLLLLQAGPGASMPTKQLEEAAARAAGQANTDNELLRQALVGCV